ALPAPGMIGELRPELDVGGWRVSGGAAHGEIEAGRHHADHQTGVSSDRDATADDGAVTLKTAHPEAVAEHHHVWLTGPVFLGENIAAEHRRNPEGREEVGGDEQAVERLRRRRGIARQIENGVAVYTDGLQRARPANDLLDVVPEDPVAGGLPL